MRFLIEPAQPESIWQDSNCQQHIRPKFSMPITRVTAVFKIPKCAGLKIHKSQTSVNNLRASGRGDS